MQVAPADVPVVLWRKEIHRTRDGVYVRVNLYLDETRGEPVLLLESSTDRITWEQCGVLL